MKHYFRIIVLFSLLFFVMESLLMAQGLMIFYKDGSSMNIPNSAIDSVVAYGSGDHEVKFSSSNMTLQPFASSQNIEMTGDIQWHATSSNDWIRFSPSEGNGSATIHLSLLENKEKVGREGSIVFSFLGMEKTITITQQSYFLNVSPEQLLFQSKGGEQNLTILSNGDWSLSTSADWLDIPTGESGNKTIPINALDNASATNRSTTLSVKISNGIEKLITIQQNGRKITLPFDTLKVGCKSESDTINCQSDGALSIKSSVEWITTSYQNGKLIVSVLENKSVKSRVGDVTISVLDIEGKIERVLTVYQLPQGSFIDKNPFNEDSDLNTKNSNSSVEKNDFENDSDMNTPENNSAIDKEDFTEDIAL